MNAVLSIFEKLEAVPAALRGTRLDPGGEGL